MGKCNLGKIAFFYIQIFQQIKFHIVGVFNVKVPKLLFRSTFSDLIKFANMKG